MQFWLLYFSNRIGPYFILQNTIHMSYASLLADVIFRKYDLNKLWVFCLFVCFLLFVVLVVVVVIFKRFDYTVSSVLPGNFNRNTYIFIQENPFQNVVWKIVAILSRPQCVKPQLPPYDPLTFVRCTYVLLKNHGKSGHRCQGKIKDRACYCNISQCTWIHRCSTYTCPVLLFVSSVNLHIHDIRWYYSRNYICSYYGISNMWSDFTGVSFFVFR